MQTDLLTALVCLSVDPEDKPTGFPARVLLGGAELLLLVPALAFRYDHVHLVKHPARLVAHLCMRVVEPFLLHECPNSRLQCLVLDLLLGRQAGTVVQIVLFIELSRMGGTRGGNHTR